MAMTGGGGTYCKDCGPRWRDLLPKLPWIVGWTSREGRRIPCSECGEPLGDIFIVVDHEREET